MPKALCSHMRLMVVVALYGAAAQLKAYAHPSSLPEALPASPPSRDGAELQRAVDRTIASGASELQAPAAAYFFQPGVSLVIAGASRLAVAGSDVDGNTTTLWFHCGCGVHIANATDVTFERFVISYVDPCFSQGVVASKPTTLGGGESVHIRFDTLHFPSAAQSLALAGKLSEGSVKLTFWDPQTLRIVAPGNHLVYNVSEAADATVVAYRGDTAPFPGAVAPGTLATLHPRLGISNGTGVAAGLTYLVTNSTRVSTVNLTVHGGATEAVVEAGGEGNNTYRGIRVTRRDGESPVRLLAANADGFHSSCVRVGPTLVGSEIAFTGDDLLNIHSRMAIVLRPLSPTSAYVIDTVGSSSPGDYDTSTLTLERTSPGDTVAFWALGTLACLGDSRVESLQRVSDPAVVAEAAAAQGEINAPPFNQRISHPFGTRVWRVNWTGPLPGGPSPRFSLVDNPALRPRGAVVRGNWMHDSYMRAGLFDSPGAVVEGNTFARAFPVYVGEWGDGWLEGPPLVKGVIMRNNTFEEMRGACPWRVNPNTTSGVKAVGQGNRCVSSDGRTTPCGPC